MKAVGNDNQHLAIEMLLSLLSENAYFCLKFLSASMRRKMNRRMVNPQSEEPP